MTELSRDLKRRSRIWRGDAAGGASRTTPTEVSEGMVVLDAIHRIQADAGADLAVRWNCKAGKCGSCSAEINGKPRLMCMTRLNELRPRRAGHVEPMRAFPLIKDLVTDVSWNYRVKKSDQAVQAAPRRRARRHLADGSRRRRPRAGVPQVHRVLPVPGRLPRPARPRGARRFIGPRFLVYASRPLEMHPLDTEDRAATEGRARHRLLQHHQVLHQGLPRAHHDHRQRDHPAQGARGGRRSSASGWWARPRGATSTTAGSRPSRTTPSSATWRAGAASTRTSRRPRPFPRNRPDLHEGRPRRVCPSPSHGSPRTFSSAPARRILLGRPSCRGARNRIREKTGRSERSRAAARFIDDSSRPVDDRLKPAR
jgi:succinate dehydrogenase / fumarate reductase iron-sulfur subunit